MEIGLSSTPETRERLETDWDAAPFACSAFCKQTSPCVYAQVELRDKACLLFRRLLIQHEISNHAKKID